MALTDDEFEALANKAFDAERAYHVAGLLNTAGRLPGYIAKARAQYYELQERAFWFRDQLKQAARDRFKP